MAKRECFTCGNEREDELQTEIHACLLELMSCCHSRMMTGEECDCEWCATRDSGLPNPGIGAYYEYGAKK